MRERACEYSKKNIGSATSGLDENSLRWPGMIANNLLVLMHKPFKGLF